MEPFDLLVVLSAFFGILFVGGLWADRFDAANRRAERRARSEDGPRWQ